MLRAATVLLVAIVSGTSVAAPVDLPTVDASSSLGTPNEHRVRIVVTKDSISVKLRDGSSKQVTVVKDGTVAAADLRGLLIISLEAALQPKPETGDLPDRFFSSAVDGWAELWIDRATPFRLASLVVYTAAQCGLGQLALGVTTPSGERTIDLIVPSDFAGLDMLTLGVEQEQLLIATGSGPTRKAKPTVAAVRTAVAAFEKQKAKGRPPMRTALGPWRCLADNGLGLGDEKCWHGRIIVAAGDEALWGTLLPLVSTAHAIVRDVVFAQL
jgi:hypothetical protein